MAELIARLKVHIANARVMMGARVALDATGRHLLAVDDRGAVLWATPQASGLIAQCFGLAEGTGALPADVSAGLAEFLTRDAKPNTPHLLVHDQGQINATYLCALGGREFVFRLAPPGPANDEDVLRLELGLTAREAEALAWLSKGKTNQDISQILGISARTVDQHIERIFTKLGVENRSAATSTALKILINRKL
jgi:DNA-binding CsgD family transcriptional regulator